MEEQVGFAGEGAKAGEVVEAGEGACAGERAEKLDLADERACGKVGVFGWRWVVHMRRGLGRIRGFDRIIEN